MAKVQERKWREENREKINSEMHEEVSGENFKIQGKINE